MDGLVSVIVRVGIHPRPSPPTPSRLARAALRSPPRHRIPRRGKWCERLLATARECSTLAVSVLLLDNRGGIGVLSSGASASGEAMPRVFVSYRRSDNPDAT